MKNAGSRFAYILLCAFLIATGVASSAQTFTRLAKFNGTNGEWPLYGSLIQGTDGNFWGTTEFGGSNFSNLGEGQGTVFMVTPEGKLTAVYSFCPNPQDCTTGTEPYYGLVQDTAGNFFGLTEFGGGADKGTLFELTPQGELTTIHSFCTAPNCADGADPGGPPILAHNGNFYGSVGGGYSIYEVTPADAFTYTTFSQAGGLGQFIEVANGFLGLGGPGAHRAGSIGLVTRSGEYETLYSLCSEPGCTDGSGGSWLIQGADGNYYGDTLYGGEYNSGVVFKLTPSGQYSVLYNFCSQANCADGATPYGSLMQATDGNFYGTTTFGGVPVVNGQLFEGYGTVFQLTPAGVLTTLHTFCEEGGQCAQGAYPLAGLVQGTDGNFYGTASGIGPGLDSCPGNCGSVFKISMGLAPFVQANPSFGKVGHAVNILGNNLTGTTSVSFNGTPATFTVISPTYIKAEVPSGATTGTIEVTTPSGTLSSNVPFGILP